MVKLGDARHLADHGEGPEALSLLAWLVIQERLSIPAGVVDEIRLLSENYTYPEDFPQGLDELAIPAGP